MSTNFPLNSGLSTKEKSESLAFINLKTCRYFQGGIKQEAIIKNKFNEKSVFDEPNKLFELPFRFILSIDFIRRDLFKQSVENSIIRNAILYF